MIAACGGAAASMAAGWAILDESLDGITVHKPNAGLVKTLRLQCSEYM
jgi:hypothetical protein